MSDQKHAEAEHEYVEFTLTFRDGVCVACEHAGEGRQVEPITEPLFFKPLDGTPLPLGYERAVVRRLRRALRSDAEDAT